MMFILSTIPYILVGIILGSMGYNYENWQTYVILIAMVFSDIISRIRSL